LFSGLVFATMTFLAPTRLAIVCSAAAAAAAACAPSADAFLVRPQLAVRRTTNHRGHAAAPFSPRFCPGRMPMPYRAVREDTAAVPEGMVVASKRDELNTKKFLEEMGKNLSTLNAGTSQTDEHEPTNDGEGLAECVDIVRDLNGRPLPVQYFAEALDVDDAVAYTCPESEAFRGLMSNACRVRLIPGGQTAFYKRIIFENLDHAKEKLKSAPYKLISDSKSYEVVAAFLSSKACQMVSEEAGVRIPKCLDARLEPNKANPIESKFSFLLEDLPPSDGWYQRWLLRDMDECEAALTTLAKIHAYFWNGSSFWNDADAARELEEGVWESSDYVQMKRNPTHCAMVAKKWETERLKCKEELSGFDYWDNLGSRLEAVAVDVGLRAHPFADDALSESYQKYRTYCHGDPKQANFLIRRGTAPDSEIQLGLIDFQWAGFGLAACDVAHYMTSAVHADRLVDGGEDVLLRYYYDELQKYLVEFGAFPNANAAIQNYSYSTFMEQYDTGFLDICRFVIAYAWSRFEPVEDDDEEGRIRTMNKNSYNKSVPNAVWLMTRCDEILKSRGA